MAETGKAVKDLSSFLTSCAIGAIGVAAAAPVLPAAAIVANLISGLAVNYASKKISPLLGSFSSQDWSATNFDLDRVAKHALLAILYETLAETTTEEEAKKTVKEAADDWDLRIVKDAVPDESELIELLREPRILPDAQAEALAYQVLRRHHAAYSAALAARFARTFEILLRNDERAFRAATVYLQRLSLSDLKALRGFNGEVARALDFLTRPQPELQLFGALLKDEKESPKLWDLQFKRRATGYRLRTSIQPLITEWLLSDDVFRILKITGPAGMGKSRLALQLGLECDRDGWLAGFVDTSSASHWPQPWTAVRPTLVIVDYAASKLIGGLSVFEWIESLFHRIVSATADSDIHRVKVRIVLIDRTDEGPLWSEWRNSEQAGDLDRLTLSIPLGPDREEFDSIVRDEFHRRKARYPSPAEQHAIESLSSRLNQQFRPLFGLLTAAAIADLPPGSTEIWSPELLVESVLKSQRHQWETAGITDEHLDLLYEATLTQGACNADAGFNQRLEALNQAARTALATLSETDLPLGPIVPDLLGEFFVLMRLRGEGTGENLRAPGSRHKLVNIRRSHEILEKSWQYDTTAAFAGLLLEDYLKWEPTAGSNPAIEVMRQALAKIESGASSVGLRYCCFAAAGKKPDAVNWLEWLQQLPSSSGFVQVTAMGLYNATVGEPDLAKCLALAERIDQLHREHGQEPGVREWLAQALYNAAVGEPDPAKCLALAERIDQLHREHGQEPGVREWLAQALFNATVGEPDPAKRLALAERIDQLHREHGQEPAVREWLAQALFNATVGEPDPAKCLALAERIDQLHREHGQEPAVRESLAKALFNATVGEPDPAKRLALAERIDQLHREHGQEPAVREWLAQALFDATVVEPDPAKRLALAERIDQLHREHGQEPAVREQLAQALFNATVGEPDPAKRLALAARIDQLHREHGQEPAVREWLAQALCNATVVEPDPAKRLALAERIDQLHREHGQEPAVRESLAQVLYNATVVEPDAAKRLALAARIDQLHREHGQEPAVRERLAQALYNATVVEPDPAKCLALAERIDQLHREHGQEPGVREQLAQALYNATVGEPDPAKCLALAERIDQLHREHGQEPAVRESLAQALYSATVGEPDPAKCLALAERIDQLHREHGQEPAVRESLAQALYNATVGEPDAAKRLALAARIDQLHREHGQEPAVRERLAKALANATVGEPDPAKRLALIARLERLVKEHPGEPVPAEALEIAWQEHRQQGS